MLMRLGVKGVIQTAASVDEAMEFFNQESTRAIFLDIEMPGSNGFDLLSKIGKERPPVVFTTAYEQFALRAFEEEAVDYLLKPFSEERLARVLARLGPDPTSAPRLTTGDSILLKFDDGCELVPLERIQLMETTGNTTHVFYGHKTGKVNKSLKALSGQLDPKLFFRSSRDQLVNLSGIDSFEIKESGLVEAILLNKKKVIFSRRQSSLFRQNQEF